MFGHLAGIKSNLSAGVYANEYEFQEDVYKITALSHDGHFYFYVDLLTKAIEWGRQLGLVSISSDGNEIPQIYVYRKFYKFLQIYVLISYRGCYFITLQGFSGH